MGLFTAKVRFFVRAKERTYQCFPDFIVLKTCFITVIMLLSRDVVFSPAPNLISEA